MRRSKKKLNEASIELKFTANLFFKISPLFMKMRHKEEQQNLLALLRRKLMSADRVVLNGTKNEGGIVLCITGILDCKFINVAEDSLVVLENFQKDLYEC